MLAWSWEGGRTHVLLLEQMSLGRVQVLHGSVRIRIASAWWDPAHDDGRVDLLAWT